MLDQIHGDDPLQTSGTGPIDVDNDSSSGEEPAQIGDSIKGNLRYGHQSRVRELNKTGKSGNLI